VESGKWKVENPNLGSAQSCRNTSDNFFYLCSLHIGIRQGAAVLELGDLLEAVASKSGSPQLGG
jgi:hypothetical protein